MSAGVMIANVIWNMTKTVSGIVPDAESALTPARNALPNPPVSPPRNEPSPNVIV